MCSYTEVTSLWLLAVGVMMMVLMAATPKLLLFPKQFTALMS